MGASLSVLPADCRANILSLITPLDTCTLSMVSKTFQSVADSDDVWKRFLPSDYRSIISRSDGSSPSVTPLKQLYFRLCNTPLLIDGGNKSFSLEKWTGKKCFMIAARELTIIWGDAPDHWSWGSLPQSRFAEVAELRKVCWLEIRGKINTGMLSPETKYAAYLVCKFTKHASGFYGTPLDVSVGIVGGESSTQTVCFNISEGLNWPHIGPILFDPAHALALQPSMPRERGDEWCEIELGEYFNEGETDEELEMSLMEVERGNWKWGLIIQGIEIRPKRE